MVIICKSRPEVLCLSLERIYNMKLIHFRVVNLEWIWTILIIRFLHITSLSTFYQEFDEYIVVEGRSL